MICYTTRFAYQTTPDPTLVPALGLYLEREGGVKEAPHFLVRSYVILSNSIDSI